MTSQTGGELILYVTAADEQETAFERKIQQLTEFSVLTTPTVNEALETLDARADIGCIVSEYDLPDVDGLAFLQSVRSQFSEIPFILFTSEGNETVASKAIAARVTDYLIKEAFQDQWAELASLIEKSIKYHQSQRTLVSPEVRGKVLLEASPEPIAIVQDNAFTFANTEALDVFGCDSIETLAEQSITEVISPESSRTFTAKIERLEREEKYVDRLEAIVTGVDETETPIELTAVSIQWDGESATLLICRDISDREARKTKLQRFKKGVEASGHAIYVTDPDGMIEYVNPAFEAITGFSEEEALGKNPRILKSGEMSDEYFVDLWDTILSGAVWEETLINRRKDGELYHAHQTIAPITNEEGTIQAFVAIQTDITEQKHIEQQLRDSKESYESLFNSIRDAILVADTDYRIINCNPAFTNLFGYVLEDIEGKPAEFVYDSEAEFEEMVEAVDGHVGDPQFTHTVTYEKQSGATFPGETNVFYFRDASEEVVGFIGVIRDISQEEDRLTQLQTIDRVLRHNFQNDLNVIQGHAERIVSDGSPPVTSYAETIIETGIELQDTVDKEREITKFLLDPPEKRRIDLSQLCTRVVENFTSEYPQAEVSTTITDEAMVEATAVMERVIEELLENSVVHSDSDRPSVRLVVESTAKEVTVSVFDENPRIPAMERKVLTGERELGSMYHGSGMGLWVAQRIVTHSEGIMKFDENEPEGNVVTIHFPKR